VYILGAAAETDSRPIIRWVPRTERRKQQEGQASREGGQLLRRENLWKSKLEDGTDTK
jgi:hypothetical protein